MVKYVLREAGGLYYSRYDYKQNREPLHRAKTWSNLANIEAFLQTHPQVADAQVVGIPCEYYGEEPVGFIRLKRGETVSSLELKKYCRERIAIHKVPVSFFFVDEYPLTASGKVQKFKLRELAVQLLAEK